MSEQEVFFSIDIESDGPIPLSNSMLSIACAAFAPSGELMGTFERNIKPPPGAVQDPRTMKEFWSRFPEQWDLCTKDPLQPVDAMNQFVEWVNSFPTKDKIAVCAPAAFDWPFVMLYIGKFSDYSNPFDFRCIDIKSYVSGSRKTLYRRSAKGNWPGRWFDRDLPHTHKALDDAIEQGLSFVKIRAENVEGQDAVERVSWTFWNSFRGRPAKMVGLRDGKGRVELSSGDHMTFNESVWAGEDPTPGMDVRVFYLPEKGVFRAGADWTKLLESR